MSLVLGLIVGAVLGLTGAGGSILAVPLLMGGLGWTLPEAAPVALMAVCASATFGTVAAWDATYVRYRAALLMASASLLTSPLGLWSAAVLPVDLLTGLFAAVLVFVAVRMFRQALRAPEEAKIVRAAVAGKNERGQGGPICRLHPQTGRIMWTPPCAAVMGGIGAGTGYLAGLLGVGGGFVIVPSLRAATALSMHSAIATSLMAIALTSGGAVGAALLQGRELPWLVALPFVTGALVGMYVGRRLAPRIAGPRLQEGFSVLMLVVAAGMVARAAGLI